MSEQGTDQQTEEQNPAETPEEQPVDVAEEAAPKAEDRYLEETDLGHEADRLGFDPVNPETLVSESIVVSAVKAICGKSVEYVTEWLTDKQAGHKPTRREILERFVSGVVKLLEEYELLNIVAGPIAEHELAAAVDAVYINLLATPDAQLKSVKLWEESSKWWPVDNAENLIQTEEQNPAETPEEQPVDVAEEAAPKAE